MNSKLLRRIIIGCFITVPILSSLISTVHLVDMYFLGNPYWISITIAVAIEIGAVASFLTISILSKLNKIIVWSMFFLLFFLQVWGNVYFSYDWVSDKIAADPNWLSNFKEMMEFFSYEMNVKTAKMILSMVVGIPIPLISLMLLKSMVDYIGTDKSDVESSNIVTNKNDAEHSDVEIDKSDTESLDIVKPEETSEIKRDLSTTYFESLEEKKTMNQ